MRQLLWQGNLGLRLIGAMKLASALLLAAAGLGIFRLAHGDLGDALSSFIARLHLDPENHFIQMVISRVSGISHAQLRAIGAGTFFYAALHSVEGTGLLLRRHWAEYLTVIATGSLVPVEIYELARKLTALRMAVLIVNLGIAAYLINALIHQRRDRSQSEHEGGASPQPPGARNEAAM